MKILVTGGCGFIGSNFIHYCLKKSQKTEIINLDAMLLGSKTENLSHIDKCRYKFVKGNICNKKLVSNLIAKVDCVVNFAAESHLDRSIADSSSFARKPWESVSTAAMLDVSVALFSEEVLLAPPTRTTLRSNVSSKESGRERRNEDDEVVVEVDESQSS